MRLSYHFLSLLDIFHIRVYPSNRVIIRRVFHGKNIYPTHIVLRREGRTSFEINSELIGGVLLRAYHKIPDATQTGLLRVINQQAVQQSCTVPDLLLDAMVNYWVSLCEKEKNETAV